jgi:hypothetical protein
MYETMMSRTNRIQVWKRVLTEGGSGFRSEQDGYLEAEVVIELDLDKMFIRLAGRAMRNKNGTASGLDGAVRARTVNPRRVS